MTIVEEAKWYKVRTTIRKYHSQDDLDQGAAPFEVVTCDDNLLANAGIQRMLDLLIGAGGQVMDATHCRIGAGDSSTAAVATQTDLQAIAGSTHRQFKLASSGPTRSSQTLTVVASFGASEGNFVAGWLEWCFDLGTADGTTVVAPMFNRRVPGGGLGVKVSPNVWTATFTITIS